MANQRKKITKCYIYCLEIFSNFKLHFWPAFVLYFVLLYIFFLFFFCSPTPWRTRLHTISVCSSVFLYLSICICPVYLPFSMRCSLEFTSTSITFIEFRKRFYFVFCSFLVKIPKAQNSSNIHSIFDSIFFLLSSLLFFFSPPPVTGWCYIIQQPSMLIKSFRFSFFDFWFRRRLL